MHEHSKGDVTMFDIYMLACKMTSLINKFGEWPPNYHETARTFPQIFCTLSFNEREDSKQASKNWTGREGRRHESLASPPLGPPMV